MSQKGSLLWKISKSSLSHYIYGTMHLQYKSIVWPKDQLLKLIDIHDYYFAEMNLQESANFSYSSYFLPQNKTILDYMSIKKYTKLRNILIKAFSVDIDDFKRMHPIFLQYRIDSSIASQKYSESIDEFLWKSAETFNCDMNGLESRLDQLNILQKLPIEFQIKNILDIGGNVSTYRKNIKKLIRSYENGDINSLRIKATKSMGAYKKLMVYDRNIRMSQKIDGLSFPSLITVGAGHLGGNYGMLASLKRKGWKLIPIVY